MILVDTLVWVDHLRRGNPVLAELLKQNRVVNYPMVLGKLACGNLQNRQSLLQLWQSLDSLQAVSIDAPPFSKGDEGYHPGGSLKDEEQSVASIALFGYLNRWNDTLATDLETFSQKIAERTLGGVGWDPSKHA